MTEIAQYQPATKGPQQQVNGGTSLRALCSELHARIEAFLQEDVKTERLKRVQEQTRHSLDVIQEALQRYK